MSVIAAEPWQSAETRFAEVVFPEHANHYGTLFAGTALSLMAKAAFAAGARHAGRNVVMARSDTVEFKEPVRVGELIEIVARVERSGRTSMTVAVAVFREDVADGQRRRAMHGKFEMVAVDENGRPAPISRNRSTVQADKETAP